MYRKLTLAVLLISLLFPSALATGQDPDDYTCDGGPNDALNAAQAAYESGDLETAAALANIAVNLCSNDFTRSWEAITLSENIDDELEASQTEDMIAEAEPGMVDLGDYSLFMNCVGEGSPTVIIEPGMGESSDEWADLLPTLGEITYTCVYDRLGNGHSDFADTKRTIQDQVDDLLALLEITEIDGPYVLVGHGNAGLNVLLFADQNPDLLAGMVLVEAFHPEGWGAYGFLTLDDTGTSSEFVDISVTEILVADLDDLGDLPLAVITGRLSMVNDPIWVGLQEDHVARSTNSIQLIAENSGFNIHLFAPEVIVEGVQWVLNFAAKLDAGDDSP
jgi:pimeloyl-ACP methyl ester carboxylesterase